MIIDGAEYSDKELSILRQYTNRTTEDDYKYGQRGYVNINTFFNININSSSEINKFLETEGRYFPEIYSGKDLKVLFDVIETLFRVACKYGSTHSIPRCLYREENNATEMAEAFRDNNNRTREWAANSFKSCSTSRSETDVFVHAKSYKLSIETNSYIKVYDRISFIGVNNILGSNQFFGDEKEIILPPFIVMMFRNIPLEDQKKDYELSLTKSFKDPRRVNRGEEWTEELAPFNPDLDEVSDEDLNQMANLGNNEKRTPEETAKFDRIRERAMSYIMARCKSIQAEYLKDPLQELYDSFNIDDVLHSSLASGITPNDVERAESDISMRNNLEERREISGQ